MFRNTVFLTTAAIVLAGCAGMGPHRNVVRGAGPDDMLKLREGPGLGYKVIIGLPDGTALNRHDCVVERGKLWCKVSLVERPQVSGYVSADYLSQR